MNAQYSASGDLHHPFRVYLPDKNIRGWIEGLSIQPKPVSDHAIRTLQRLQRLPLEVVASAIDSLRTERTGGATANHAVDNSSPIGGRACPAHHSILIPALSDLYHNRNHESDLKPSGRRVSSASSSQAVDQHPSFDGYATQEAPVSLAAPEARSEAVPTDASPFRQDESTSGSHTQGLDVHVLAPPQSVMSTRLSPRNVSRDPMDIGESSQQLEPSRKRKRAALRKERQEIASIECPDCPRSYKTQPNFEKHVETYHQGNKVQVMQQAGLEPSRGFHRRMAQENRSWPIPDSAGPTPSLQTPGANTTQQNFQFRFQGLGPNSAAQGSRAPPNIPGEEILPGPSDIQDDQSFQQPHPATPSWSRPPDPDHRLFVDTMATQQSVPENSSAEAISGSTLDGDFDVYTEAWAPVDFAWPPNPDIGSSR